MYKILLKKQFSELFSRMLNRSVAGIRYVKVRILIFSALAVYLLGLMGYLFYTVAGVLCAPLCGAGLSWMYFTLMGFMVTMLGLTGSIFMAHSMLYQARDNELLLSMPIPPGVILFSRMTVIYLMSFAVEAIAWLPVTVQYVREKGWSWQAVSSNVVLLFVLPLLALLLSCILGWVIALVSARIRNGVAVTVSLTLGFIGVYYYFYLKASEYLGLILRNIGAVSARIKMLLYPFYLLGRGAAGDAGSLLIFVCMTLAAFAVIYAVLSKSFIRLLTARRGAAAARYREQAVRAAGAGEALLRKEFMRLTGSAAYMLNCGLGSAVMVIGTAAAVGKRDMLEKIFLQMYPGISRVMPLFWCIAVAALSSMNTLTAPSISLEGRNLWLVKSLPVSAWQVLKAKLELQLLFSGIPSVICMVVLTVVTGQNIVFCILAPICCLLFVTVCAALGLLVNLRFPNFAWTNETIAVKQSMSVMITILASWGILAALGVLYCRLLWKWISAQMYLILAALLLGILAGVLLRILRTRGTAMFERL